MMDKWASWRMLGIGLLVLILAPVLSACGDNHDTLRQRVHETKTHEKNENSEIRQYWEQHDTYAVTGFSNRTFYVLDRKKKVNQYPCSNCHVKSFEAKKARSKEQPQQAHWEIRVDHGSNSSEEDFTCATCHNPKNPDEFTGPSGRTYTLNESFRQCGTCHQTEIKDWAGGAHGKRHDYWQGSRVIYSCADCHNPHDPAIEKRWPVTYPSIPRKSKGLKQ